MSLPGCPGRSLRGALLALAIGVALILSSSPRVEAGGPAARTRVLRTRGARARAARTRRIRSRTGRARRRSSRRSAWRLDETRLQRGERGERLGFFEPLAGALTGRILPPARFATGIPTVALEARAEPGTWGRQRKSQWCWAASSQMILNYIGLPVSQEAVIQRAYGVPLDRPASPAEIARTLNGWRVNDASGRQHMVAAVSYDQGLPTTAVLSDLTAQRPLIVGLRNPSGQGGHAYVLTAVKYDLDPQGQPVARSAVLRDPWPDNPSVIELPWAEISQRYLGAVRIDAR